MPVDPRVENEILTILNRLSGALVTRDVDGVMELFVQDESVTVLGAAVDELAVGPDDLRELVEQMSARPYDFYWWLRSWTLTAVGPVAWMAVDALAFVHDSRGDRSVPYRMTAVCVRREDRWLLAHLHGSIPTPALND